METKILTKKLNKISIILTFHNIKYFHMENKDSEVRILKNYKGESEKERGDTYI
jgi:hypothetical protein